MENELRDFIIEYGKEIMPRLAEYEIHSSTLYAIILLTLASVAIAIAIFIYFSRSKKRANGVYCGDPDFDFVWYLSLGGLAVILLAMAICEISDIYYAKYLPEKLLLRKLKYVLENL